MVVRFNTSVSTVFRALGCRLGCSWWKLTATGLFLGSLLGIKAETLSSLSVGYEVYTNVNVIWVTETDIYFTHSRGLANAKLKNLDPAFQKKFDFDAGMAAVRELQQAEGNTRYITASLVSAMEREKLARKGAKNPAISVEIANPSVEYTYYERTSSRPPEVPEGMSAVTRHSFRCNTDLSFQSNKTPGPEGFRFRFQKVKVSLELPILITLPENPSPRLRAHEEGHRKIHEHFYELGAQAAQLAGQAILDKDVTSKEKDYEAAKTDAVAQAGKAVQAEYWKYTKEPAEQAGQYYDEITGHGRNPLDADLAAQEAIARYEVQMAGKE